jgi:SAM-dependent methyltransferase
MHENVIRPSAGRRLAKRTLEKLGLLGIARQCYATLSRREDAYLSAPKLETRFATIYRRRLWSNGKGDTPGSGEGSRLESTATIRRHLPSLLDDLEATDVLDVGCGDFTWMQTIALRQRYVGVDVVPAVIAENTRRHGSSTRQFLHLDATRDPLPHADVVLCRDVLFHLSFGDIQRVLSNVRQSQAQYLIATTDPDIAANEDIRSGEFRLLNLSAPPISLGPPERAIADPASRPHRVLGVWVLRQVR